MTVKEEYEMFSAIWKLYRVYREVRDSDEFYVKVVAEAHCIHDKYPTALCEDLLLAVVKEINDRGRRLHVKTNETGQNSNEQAKIRDL